MVTEERVRQALGKVMHPELERDVVGLEMIRDIETAAIRIRDVVRRLEEITDRVVPYQGETQMIDIHGDPEPPDQVGDSDP